MVVEQGEGMAAAPAEGKVALKIPLPEPVRGVMFEPARGRVTRCRARQQAMAGHEVMDGAESRHAVPLVFQPALNIAGAPALMSGTGHTQQGRDVVR